MKTTPQKRALQKYRDRLKRSGLARFDVLGLGADRQLVRAFARRLAENDAEAARLRTEVGRQVVGTPAQRGGILAALRRSPLVGADLSVEREVTPGRDVDL
jgi:hypothetical protein